MNEHGDSWLLATVDFTDDMAKLKKCVRNYQGYSLPVYTNPRQSTEYRVDYCESAL